MNNSKQGFLGLGSSPGFLYYNVNTPDTSTTSNSSLNNTASDYNDFGNTNSPQGKFEPRNYSSPQKNFRQRFSHNYTRNSRGYDSNDSGNRSYNSPYGRFNNRNSSREDFRDRSKNQRKFNADDISLYVCKSMLENPWKELEEEMESARTQNNSESEASDANSNESGEVHDD